MTTSALGPQSDNTPPRWASTRFQALSAAAVCLTLSVALLFGLSNSDRSRATGLTILVGLLSLGVLRYETRRAGRVGLVSPISLFFVFWWVYIFLAGLSAFGAVTGDPLLPGGTSELLVAYGATFIALCFIAIGYWCATRHFHFSGITKTEHRAPLSHSAVYALLLVGWSARVIRFQQGSFGYVQWAAAHGLVSRLLVLADGLVPFVMAAVALELWHARPAGAHWHRNLLIANVGALTVVALASGVKGQLLLDLMPIAIVYVATRGRIPWRALIAIALFIVIEYSGVQSYRVDIANGTIAAAQRRGIASNVTAVVGRIGQSWSGSTPQSHFREAWHGLSTEYAATVRTLAIIMHDTPSSSAPFLGVKRLVVAPVIFLPSNALGAGVTDDGAYVNVTYLRGGYSQTGRTSGALTTQMGDLYMSGGWLTLVVGEFVVGIVSGLIWRFVTRSGELPSWLLYAMVATAFANSGLDWLTLIRTLLEFTIVYLPIARLLFRRPYLPAEAVLIDPGRHE